MTNENALKQPAPHAHTHLHGDDHDHGDDHGQAPSHSHAHAHAADACCGSASGHGPIPLVPAVTDVSDVPKGAQLFRIPTMDCAVEESEIRRALEPVAGVKALRFRLGERTMAITADDAALPEALAAIRKAGFKPEPLNAAGGPASGTQAAAAPAQIAGMSVGLARLVAALVLAIAAESISFMGFESKGFMAAEMVLALGAIGLAGWTPTRRALPRWCAGA
jgi:Cd2+/Zn2+-exporting ATPase